MFGLDAAAVAKQPGERRRAAQPVPLIRAYCGFAVALDREPGAALGAPCTQDLAAADAFHPGAKAVRPLAPDDRRLVGALHDLFPFKKSLTLERFAYRPVKIIRFEVLVQYEPSFGYKYLGKAPAVIDSGQDFHLDLAPNGFRHNPKGAVSGRRYMVFAKPKFNNKNIDDAGDVLRGELTSLTLDEALDIINNWRASHSYPLQAIKMMLRNRAHSIDKTALVSQRLKRLPSIRNKLIRPQSQHMRLSQMQDIGGCRAVVANITAVDKLAALFRKGVSKNPTGRHQILGEPKNYIASPKADGYRSIHYTFRYQTKSPELEIYNGQRIEIQIRSRLQHAWATAVETVDTMTGQSIKFALGSNVGDPQWKRFFALMGSAIALRERRHLVPGTPQLRAELTGELRAVSTEIDAQRVLTGLGETVRVLEQSPNKKAFAYLLVLNAKTRSISVFSFSRDKLQDVEREYLRIEKENDPDVQAVQVSVEEIASLRAAYPNYYLDTRAFVEALQEAIKT